MYKRLPILLVIIILSACHKIQQQQGCGAQICSEIFVTIQVMFQNSQGSPIAVKNFTVIDTRTGTNITTTDTTSILGNYIVVEDSQKKLLSANGDTLTITATNPSTGHTTTFQEKIAGGLCACHVTKLSGPDAVTLN